jgi:predicted short-subunit dehydrogenase-like oxidoreductase (DUF2520 family)
MDICIVGPGRVGHTLAARLADRGRDVTLTRHAEDGREARCVLLAVPDDDIAECARTVGARPWLGMLSGATPLAALGVGRLRAFVIHPVQTITLEGGATQLDGAPACVTGSDDEAAAYAERLAAELGLEPVRIPESVRPLPHIASVLASNYLVAPLAAAARVLEAAGLPPSLVAPLAHRAVENALAAGTSAVPTGPIARGDAGTVGRHLTVLRERAPAVEPLYRTLGAATLPLVDPAAAARVAPLLGEVAA